jgi:hypothetical protein
LAVKGGPGGKIMAAHKTMRGQSNALAAITPEIKPAQRIDIVQKACMPSALLPREFAGSGYPAKS